MNAVKLAFIEPSNQAQRHFRRHSDKDNYLNSSLTLLNNLYFDIPDGKL